MPDSSTSAAAQTAAKQESARQQWMAGQPATARQLEYLTRFGYDGPPPQTRGEASDLIQSCLRIREDTP